MAAEKHRFIRQDLLELAAAYADFSVIITTAELVFPGPQFLYVNSAFTRMTGYSVSELLGKTPRILQGPKTDANTLRLLRESLSSGQDFIARAINYKRDGTPFELEWIISHLKDSYGETTHYVALQRDITGHERAQNELHRYDNELRQANELFRKTLKQLEKAEQTLKEREKLATMGELTAGIVHDLSNALTPVFGMVQMLHTLDNLPTEADYYVNSLEATTQHAIDLLNNLKHYYRSANSVLIRQRASLRTILESIPDFTKPKWWSPDRQTENGINFGLDLADVPDIFCNETELAQVFLNLVNNAIDAMPNGGRISIQLSTNGDHNIVRILDSGTGMATEKLARCFEPYYTTKFNGTGLGLNVCKRIIEDHKGTIDVESNPTFGTNFTIVLPNCSANQLVNSRQSTFEGARILHVDSNHTREELLSRRLRDFGHIVDVAPSGDEGLRKFYEGEYDVVIAGSGMHPTSGYDVSQAIKRSRPEIPVVISVGLAEEFVPDNLPEHLHPDGVIRSTDPDLDLKIALQKLGLGSDCID